MGKLQCESPVPSDIKIAQAATPVHISNVAQAAGLGPDEYDLYGITKAKVRRRASALSPALRFCTAVTYSLDLGCMRCANGSMRHLLQGAGSLSWLHLCVQVKLNVIHKHANAPDGNYGEQLLCQCIKCHRA